MELDRLMPQYDVEKRHDRTMAATQDAVWDALMDLDLNDSRLIRSLMLARGITRRSLGWADFERFGFLTLHCDRPREFVLGVVAQPWKLTGGIRRIDPEAFAAFDEAGNAVIAWNHFLQPDRDGTNVTTITRIRCTDESSRSRFRRYWRIVGPFSGVVRTQTLQLLTRRAAGPAR